MLTKLRLQNFKSYKDAELTLGPLTILVGTNASGKSNIRDAMRFIHGISRGYSIADIMGEKYAEGGVLQWSGIRGGPQEITFQKARSFILKTSFTYQTHDINQEGSYSIEVEPGINGEYPCIPFEEINIGDNIIIRTLPGFEEINIGDNNIITRTLPGDEKYFDHPTVANKLVREMTLNHYFGSGKEHDRAKNAIDSYLGYIEDIRFLDLDLSAMRRPSRRGQRILGDRCENLSSVLDNICSNEGKKKIS